MKCFNCITGIFCPVCGSKGSPAGSPTGYPTGSPAILNLMMRSTHKTCPGCGCVYQEYSHKYCWNCGNHESADRKSRV